MSKKKSKTVMVDGIPLKPISAAEQPVDRHANQEEERKTSETIPRGSRQESGLDFALD